MPGETFIQVEGSGYRIDAQLLKAEFERSGQLRSHLQKYVLASMVQSAQNAACNRLHTISERLARWLLTCHDRIQSDHMPLTHEFLARCWVPPEPPLPWRPACCIEAGLIDYTAAMSPSRTVRDLSTSHASAMEPSATSSVVSASSNCLMPDGLYNSMWTKLVATMSRQLLVQDSLRHRHTIA